MLGGGGVFREVPGHGWAPEGQQGCEVDGEGTVVEARGKMCLQAAHHLLYVPRALGLPRGRVIDCCTLCNTLPPSTHIHSRRQAALTPPTLAPSTTPTPTPTPTP